MRLTELRVVEQANYYEHIVIWIEYRNIFYKKKTARYELFKKTISNQWRFLKDGRYLFVTYFHLDNSINALMSKKDPNYKA